MLGGSLLVVQASGFNGLIAGRVISGIGGVIVNVVMTKMVIDWFAGHRIATAMAVFLGSWPMGIALALVVLPYLAGVGGLELAWIGLIVVNTIAVFLFTTFYRAPEGISEGGATLKIAALPWRPLILAAIVWGIYNAALAMVFGFGPVVLAERGLSTATASFATSLFMFAIVIAAPFGGWWADRSGYGNNFIMVSLVAAVLLLPVMLNVPLSYAWISFGVVGFVVGLAPGVIVSLPSQVLPPETRAFGMGIFYSIYYLLMMAAPPLAGAIADHLADANVAFHLGAAMMVLAIIALWLFGRSTTLIQTKV